MKIILTTRGNIEEGDQPLFTYIYDCDYFVIWGDGEEGPNFWIELFGYSKCPETQKSFCVGYDPLIDTITVVQ